MLFVIVGGAAVSGFALSQWLTAGGAPRGRVATRTAGARRGDQPYRQRRELMRTKARAEIETGVLRGIGAEGVAVTATVAACRPARVGPLGVAAGCASEAGAPPAAPAPKPGEPGDAVRDHRPTPRSRKSHSSAASSTRRRPGPRPPPPGQESVQARFAEKYSSSPQAGTRQVCQGFAHWSLRSRPRGARDRALLYISPRYLQSPPCEA